MKPIDVRKAFSRLGEAVAEAAAERIRPSRRKPKEFPKPRKRDVDAFRAQFVEASRHE